MNWLFRLILIILVGASLPLAGCGGGGGGGDPGNRAPIANAGADIRVSVDQNSVTLNGTGSLDPDAQSITFSWTAPTATTLTNPTTPTPTLTFTRPGIYPVTLVVSDGTFSSTDSVTVSVYDEIPASAKHPFGADQIVFAIEGAADGGFYLLGTIPESDTSNFTDIFVQKFTAAGAPAGAAISLGNPDTLDFPSALVEISSDLVAIVGTVGETNSDNAPGDAYFAVVNLSTGTIVEESIPKPDVNDLVSSIRRTADGSFLISGSTVVGANQVMRFIRIGSDYVIDWDIQVDAPLATDFGIDAHEESPTSIVVLGDTGSDIYLARIDVTNPSSPVIVAQNRISGPGTDLSLALEKTPSGFLVVGSTNSFGGGQYDILAIRTGNDLQMAGSLSGYVIGGDRDDFSVYARRVTATSAGYLVAGSTQTDSAGSIFDAVLLVLNSEGEKVDLGVYAFAGSSDDVALFTRMASGSTNYQLAGITGNVAFISPANFSIVAGEFFFFNIVPVTMRTQ